MTLAGEGLSECGDDDDHQFNAVYKPIPSDKPKKSKPELARLLLTHAFTPDHISQPTEEELTN